MAIDTPESLRQHLQTALVLEHSTIPPYLTALYSIREGANVEAAEVIRSVVMEEMLHMTLVANVMNAVGAEPAVDGPGFVPDYPCPLPHSSGAFEVGLLPFSKPALETFVRIERPAPADAPPQDEDYDTIGQFYRAIEEGLEALGPSLFDDPRPERQVQPEHFYYGGGGEVIVVESLDDALRALDEVMEQGEGLDHTIFDGDEQFGQMEEVAHYFRFNELLQERYYLDTDTPASGPTGPTFPVAWDAVWNVAPNPRAERYRDRPAIHDRMVAFNRLYTRLLGVLHRAFNGEPGELEGAVPLMYELRYAAEALVRIPTGDGDTTVGPSFEYARG